MGSRRRSALVWAVLCGVTSAAGCNVSFDGDGTPTEPSFTLPPDLTEPEITLPPDVITETPTLPEAATPTEVRVAAARPANTATPIFRAFAELTATPTGSARR